ncbi:hypothetical protein ACFL5Q_02505 [Planctomycetota bacterium]
MATVEDSGRPAPGASWAGKTRRITVLAAWALLLALVTAEPLVAEPFGNRRPDPSKASASRAARRSALKAIPLDKLDADARAKVSSVLSNVSLFRRMPVQVIQCDPDLYLFLVEHPDVVVNMWEVMGVTQLAMQATGPGTFELVDMAGTKGSVQYLYSNHDTHLIYTEGSYQGPPFAKPVRGRGLMVLKTGYVRETDGKYYVTCRLDSFMSVDKVGPELFAKTFGPLLGKVADLNFTYTVGFVASVSQTSEDDHRGMQRMAGMLTKVEPEVRQQLAVLAGQVADKAAQPTLQETARQPQVAGRPGQEDVR